jgi:hypothetical protein
MASAGGQQNKENWPRLFPDPWALPACPRLAAHRARSGEDTARVGAGQRLGYATCASALPRQTDQQMRDGLVTERE